MKDKNSRRPELQEVTRRKFIASSLMALGAASLPGLTATAATAESVNAVFTVQDVIDLIVKEVPGGQVKDTVDTLKAGNPQQRVTGIITTMFTTIPVIRQAIALKANFIIAHEPTFYNHQDDTRWLESHDVYRFKHDLLQNNEMAVWRFHDYLHRLQPDPVLMGFVKAAGWVEYYNQKKPALIILPGMSLGDIVSHIKAKFGASHVRVIGDLNQNCRRVAFLPGAPGGRRQIQFLYDEQPDVLICGEIQEWETSEYVRDERASGMNRSLIILGHALSEEPGMQWIADWLAPRVANTGVTHIPSNDPFLWL